MINTLSQTMEIEKSEVEELSKMRTHNLRAPVARLLGLATIHRGLLPIPATLVKLLYLNFLMFACQMSLVTKVLM